MSAASPQLECKLSFSCQEGYGGPPPSPVVSGGWERGYVSALDDTYMRQDPGLPLGTGTPIASGASGSGDTGYLVSGG